LKIGKTIFHIIPETNPFHQFFLVFKIIVKGIPAGRRIVTYHLYGNAGIRMGLEQIDKTIGYMFLHYSHGIMPDL
jgi:hypothetical protein